MVIKIDKKRAITISCAVVLAIGMYIVNNKKMTGIPVNRSACN